MIPLIPIALTVCLVVSILIILAFYFGFQAGKATKNYTPFKAINADSPSTSTISATPLEKTPNTDENNTEEAGTFSANKNTEEQINLERELQQKTTELRQTNELLRQEIRDRQVSESALRYSELRLWRLFESDMIGIGIWENDSITYGNNLLCSIIGYDKEELTQNTLNWKSVTPPEYIKIDEEKFLEMNQNRFSTPYEKEFFRKDGSRVPVLIGGCCIDESCNGGFFFVLDNTERKRSQIALIESEERFRATFEQAAVGIAHVSSQGEWLRVNSKVCEITGYSESELLSIKFQNITHPDDLEPDLEYVRQMLEGEISTYSMEKRYICKDKSIVWVNLTVSLVKDEKNQPKYFISVIEDITDRKQLKTALRKSIERLQNLHQLDRAVLEKQQPEEIASVAIAKLNPIIASERTSICLFDFDRETSTILQSKGLGEDIASAGFQSKLNLFSPIIEELNQGSKYAVGNFSIFEFSEQMRALHSHRLKQFIAIPLKFGDDLLGILKIWTNQYLQLSTQQLDIIREICDQLAIALHQAQLNKKIQEYTEELEIRVKERTTRLQEINNELESFTYTVSHDLRAPLRSLQGFATAILEDYGENLDELGSEYAQRLVSSAKHMDRLIQDLLTYSRLSRAGLHLTRIDLSIVIAEAVNLLEAEIGESEARITICELLLKVKGNKTVLVQAISNILSNAIKFVTFEKKPNIRIWSEERESRVRLWIEDEGIGISKEHLDRIFRVFERLHGSETYSGTGIGLAIVRKGIERIGGSVGVESNLNVGSRFWIELEQMK